MKTAFSFKNLALWKCKCINSTEIINLNFQIFNQPIGLKMNPENRWVKKLLRFRGMRLRKSMLLCFRAKREFRLSRCAQRFLGLKLIQIFTFFFQRVEISLPRCVVIRISCFAHALRHVHGFAVFLKCFWCIPGSLIAVQDQPPFDCRLRIKRFQQCADCKVTGDVAVCKEQICKVRTPFLRSAVSLQPRSFLYSQDGSSSRLEA